MAKRIGFCNRSFGSLFWLAIVAAFLLAGLPGVSLADSSRSVVQSTGPPPIWSQPPLQAVYNVSARSNASATWLGGTPAKGLLFGGIGCGGFCNDTWVFSESESALTWFPVPTIGPSAREGAALATDPLLGGAVLFGGKNNVTFFNDTWFYNASLDAWSRMPISHAPPPLAFASMVWDSRVNGLVLFGGETAGGAPSGETWVFQGGIWSELALPRVPAARWGAAFSYNPTTFQAYLFGGTNGTTLWNDTWIFQNESWSQLPLAQAPSPRYDSASSATAGGYPLLYGGFGKEGVLNDTWTFLNGTWQNLTPLFTPMADTPPPTGGASLVPTPSIRPNLFILFGGVPFHYSTIVPWELFVPMGGTPGGIRFSISASTLSGTSPLTVEFSASPSGGFPPYNYTWGFGPTEGYGYGPVVRHTFRVNLSTQFSVTLTVTDSQGNQVSNAVKVAVFPAPIAPSPPPPIPWLWLGLLWIVAGLFSLGAFAWVDRGVRSRKDRRAVLSGFSFPTAVSFPRWFGSALFRLAKHRDIRTFSRELRAELSLRWEEYRSSPSFRHWRGFGTPLLRVALETLSRLVLVVGIVFVLVGLVPTIGTNVTVIGQLTSFGKYLYTFFTGAWLQQPLPYTIGGSLTLPIVTLVAPTLELGLVSLALSVLISYPLGLASGWKRGHALDNSTRVYSALGLFWPTILLSLYFVGWFYALWIGLFGSFSSVFGLMPQNASWYDANMGGIPRWVSPYMTTSPTGFPLIDAAWHGAWFLEAYIAAGTLLQASVIALIYSSIYLRYLRTSSAESAEEPDVVAARSRGVTERTLLWKHAARRSLPLYISAFSTTFGAFLITLTVVQVVFADVGLGTSAWDALTGSVSPTSLAALVYLFTIAVVFTNAVADLLVRWLDPRTSGSEGGS